MGIYVQVCAGTYACVFVGVHGRSGLKISGVSLYHYLLFKDVYFKMYFFNFINVFLCLIMHLCPCMGVYISVQVLTQARRECWMLWSWSYTQCESSSFSSLFDGGSEDQDLSLNWKTRQFSKTSCSTSPKNPPVSILPLSRY